MTVLTLTYRSAGQATSSEVGQWGKWESNISALSTHSMNSTVFDQ